MPAFSDTNSQDLEPRVIAEAVGPIIDGQRKPPILRIRQIGVAFLIENIRLGQWRTLASTRDRNAAFQGLHEANAHAMEQFAARMRGERSGTEVGFTPPQAQAPQQYQQPYDVRMAA